MSNNKYYVNNKLAENEEKLDKYRESLRHISGSIPRRQGCSTFDLNYETIGLNGLAEGLLIGDSNNIIWSQDFGHLYGQWVARTAAVNAYEANSTYEVEIEKVFAVTIAFSSMLDKCNSGTEESFSFIHSTTWANALAMKTNDVEVRTGRELKCSDGALGGQKA